MSEYFNILLIGEEYVKNYSPLMQNVDPQVIRMHIFEAQNIDLKYIIGEDLYDEIISQYEDLKDAISTGYTGSTEVYVEPRLTTIVNKSKPYLLYRTLANSAYSLASKLTNKGIVEQSSDYSSNMDLNFVERLKKDWGIKADNYVDEVIGYLNDNIATYPEYSANSGTVPSTSFKSTLYLGSSI